MYKFIFYFSVTTILYSCGNVEHEKYEAFSSQYLNNFDYYFKHKGLPHPNTLLEFKDNPDLIAMKYRELDSNLVSTFIDSLTKGNEVSFYTLAHNRCTEHNIIALVRFGESNKKRIVFVEKWLSSQTINNKVKYFIVLQELTYFLDMHCFEYKQVIYQTSEDMVLLKLKWPIRELPELYRTDANFRKEMMDTTTFLKQFED